MIINSQLGGKQPTGTKQITSNGTHDVAGYASADVNVPTTAPQYYLPLELTLGGRFQNSRTAPFPINTTGIRSVADFCFASAFIQNTVSIFEISKWRLCF